MALKDNVSLTTAPINNSSSSKIYACFFVLIGGLLLPLATPAGAQDDRIFTVDCEDIDNPEESCSLTGSPIESKRVVDLTSAIVNALSDDDSGICSVEGNAAQCELPRDGNNPLIVNCSIDNDPLSAQRSASCQIGGFEDVVSLDCEQRTDISGKCTVTTSVSNLKNKIENLVPGLNSNSVSVGVNLLTSCALGGGTDAFQRDCEAVLDSVGNGDRDQVQKTLDEITPLNVDNIMDNSRQNVSTKIGHAQERMERVRAGSRGVDLAGLQFFDGQQWLTSGDLLAQNSEVGTDAGSADDQYDYGRLGVFIDGSIVSSEQDATSVEEKSETDTQSLTFGVDYGFTDNFVGGVAFGVGYTETDYGRDRGELESLSLSLIGYGSYYWENFYVDAAVSLGGDDYDQNRKLDCSSGCSSRFVQQAEAEFSGNQLALTVGMGYDWFYRGFNLSPYISVNSVELEIDSYRERMNNTDPEDAGSGYALDIGEQQRDMLTITAGSQFRYAFGFNWGVAIPYLNFAWINELEDDASLVNGRFVGNTGNDSNFDILTNDIDDEYFLAAGGAVFQLSEGNAAFIDVFTWQGHDEIDLTGVTAGWRWEF